MGDLKDTIKEIAIRNIDDLTASEAKFWFANDANPVMGSVDGLIWTEENENLATNYHDEIIELVANSEMELPIAELTLNNLAWWAWRILITDLDFINEVINEVCTKEK